MTDAEISRLIETSDRLIDDVSTCFHLPRRPAVAEDCDPPATRGDGALAIVSACQLPRRRGAPLLRPLARLTSFGGYVATGARLHCK